ncbi:hypothetical protein ACEPAH_6760 [Sanghuangporus vaninii]
MPLYKLFCIAAHYPEYRHIKDLVQSSANFLLDQGSAVREIRYLGLKNLPQKMRRHKHNHIIGDYWHMNFDASPTVLQQLNDRMRADHRVVRWTMLKLGERLADVADASTRETNTVYPSASSRDFSTPSTQEMPGDGLGVSSWSTQSHVAGLGDGNGIGEVVHMDQFERDRIASLGSVPYARQPL